MRAQRSGLVVTISSTAGIATTGDFLTAYAASSSESKAFVEALATEIAPYGIRTMLVEPGFFRTELLSARSTNYAEPSIDDYTDRTRATIEGWQSMDGKQGGDPAKLADALVELIALDDPPSDSPRSAADAVELFETKAQTSPRPGERPPRTLHRARPRRDLTNIRGLPRSHEDAARFRTCKRPSQVGLGGGPLGFL